MPTEASQTERTLALCTLGEVLAVVARDAAPLWVREALNTADPEGTVYGFYRIVIEGEDVVCLVGEIVRPRRADLLRRRALWYVWADDEGELWGSVSETRQWPADERRVGEWRG